MGENILGGFIANAIFTLAVIIMGWLLYYLTERRKLLKFFNINESKRLVVYLSNLWVFRGGSKGIDDNPRAYTGATVVLNELNIANKYKEGLNYLMPSLSESPSLLSKILFADIKVTIIPSPTNQNEIESNTTVVSFGSPGYNLVSKTLEDNPKAAVRFVDDNRAIQVANLPLIKDTQNGFIQRIVLNSENSKRSLFYVAGLSELGTIGAAFYLITNWKKIRKKYKDDESFVLFLRFSTTNLNNYTIDFERKIE